jgi:uncharacterized protein YqhQ
MLFFGIASVIIIVSIIFRIASALGLTIPLIYGLIAPTLFSDWFHANQTLAEGIGWALVGLVALCWLVSLIHKICEVFDRHREDRFAVKMFLDRLEKAKAEGRNDVSTEDLWR